MTKKFLIFYFLIGIVCSISDFKRQKRDGFSLKPKISNTNIPSNVTSPLKTGFNLKPQTQSFSSPSYSNFYSNSFQRPQLAGSISSGNQLPSTGFSSNGLTSKSFSNNHGLNTLTPLKQTPPINYQFNNRLNTQLPTRSSSLSSSLPNLHNNLKPQLGSTSAGFQFPSTSSSSNSQNLQINYGLNTLTPGKQTLTINNQFSNRINSQLPGLVTPLGSPSLSQSLQSNFRPQYGSSFSTPLSFPHSSSANIPNYSQLSASSNPQQSSSHKTNFANSGTSSSQLGNRFSQGGFYQGSSSRLPQGSNSGRSGNPIVGSSYAGRPSQNAGCTIDIQRLPNNHPVLIRPGTNQFLYPGSSNGRIELTANQQIELWCSDTLNFAPQKSTIVTCVPGQQLNFEFEDSQKRKTKISSSQFQCRTMPQNQVMRTATTCSTSNAILVNVGFQIDATRWANIYTVCHDTALETSLYSHYKLTRASNRPQRETRPDNFVEAGFFNGKNVKDLYDKHRTAVGKILNNFELGRQYFEISFLNKGHMAAKADFVYATQQLSTFLFINVAPQWESFNSGNWNNIEMISRAFASTLANDLEVYTGTHGTMQLADRRGQLKDILLSGNTIPVPKIFYKILVNRAANSGVVIIGINNPHLTNTQISINSPSGYKVCQDVSNQAGLESLTGFNRNDFAKGYIYACSVREFLPTIPLLTNSLQNIQNLLPISIPLQSLPRFY